MQNGEVLVPDTVRTVCLPRLKKFRAESPVPHLYLPKMAGEFMPYCDTWSSKFTRLQQDSIRRLCLFSSVEITANISPDRLTVGAYVVHSPGNDVVIMSTWPTTPLLCLNSVKKTRHPLTAD